MTTLVLCYHTLGDWDHAMAVPPARLRAQLEFLLDRGYRGTTFTSAVLRPRPGKWLVVTFDDGFRAVHDLALPVLTDLGLPGTAFVATSFVGSPQLSWPGFEPGRATACDLEPLEPRQVRALAQAGWEVGSHTRTHPWLTRLDDDALRSELGGAREECAALTGNPCTSVAYPFGDVDDRVAEVARQVGHTAGASLGVRAGRRRSLQVSRTAVYRGDGASRFRLKTSLPLRTTPLGLAVTGAHTVWQHVGGRPRSRSLT